MLDVIMVFYHQATDALSKGVDLDKMLNLKIREDISRAKLIEEGKLETFDQLRANIKEQFLKISEKA